MSKHIRTGALVIAATLASCASEPAPLDGYEEVASANDLAAPAATQPASAAVDHGRYLVELLGCGSCHTDGALVGAPDRQRWLAGSSIGIAYTNPLDEPLPGIVYPKNLTADKETGLGGWSDAEIKAAIVHGRARNGMPNVGVMPWRSFARLSADDLDDITQYLKSLPPVRHRVPDNVLPGQPAVADFVHFGIYTSRNE